VNARGARLLPPISAIDPLKLPRELLPSLSSRSTSVYAFALPARRSSPLLDMRLTVNTAKSWRALRRQPQRVSGAIKSKTPYFCGGKLVWSPKDFKTHKALILPFGNETNEVTRFLGSTDFAA